MIKTSFTTTASQAVVAESNRSSLYNFIDATPLDMKKMCLIDADQYTILIVDDDKVNRLVIGSYLSYCDYKIIQADDGPTALDIVVQNSQIDLLILDVMMPNMSGFSVCEEIRKIRSIEELPIIFLTADGHLDSLVNAFCLGGNDYLIIPVYKWELLLRVKNLISITGNTKL